MGREKERGELKFIVIELHGGRIAVAVDTNGSPKTDPEALMEAVAAVPFACEVIIGAHCRIIEEKACMAITLEPWRIRSRAAVDKLKVAGFHEAPLEV